MSLNLNNKNQKELIPTIVSFAEEQSDLEVSLSPDR